MRSEVKYFVGTDPTPRYTDADLSIYPGDREAAMQAAHGRHSHIVLYVLGSFSLHESEEEARLIYHIRQNDVANILRRESGTWEHCTSRM